MTPGRPGDAAPSPSFPVLALLRAGRRAEAATLWRTLIGQAHADWQSWADLGEVGNQLGQVADAIGCFRAAAMRTTLAIPAIRLAHLLLLSGDKAQALIAARDATARHPVNPAELSQLGTIFAHCDAGERALPLLERAVKAAPDDPQHLYNLATAQRTNGRLQAAEASADAMLRLSPDDAEAFYLRSGLRRQTTSANHIEAIGAAIARRGGRSHPADAPLHFAAYKEYEDLGRFEEAFAHLDRGNRLRRSALRYDVAADVATIDALIVQHTRAGLGLDDVPGASSSAPIFILGLPRSGTTLVERILASHPAVTAGGELDAFPQSAVRLLRDRSGGAVGKQGFVSGSLDIPGDALGEAYLEAVREQRGTTPRFTDKLPINYLYAGLIRKALPDARIVALRRNPMANGFAIFGTLFGAAYPFAYDLAEIGTYLAAWRRLMDHWAAVLGPSLFTVDYEELVDEPEAVSRRLLTFCGLEWDPACLMFDSQPGSVSSASAAQVRQPIHSGSVAKWREFKTHLSPLRDALR